MEGQMSQLKKIDTSGKRRNAYVSFDKKGQLNLDVARGVMVSFLVLGVIAVAVVLALISLRDSNIFTAGTPEAIDVNNSIRNITSGVTGFFDDTGTIFSILVVVVIISAIALVIFVVTRFGGSGGRGGL